MQEEIDCYCGTTLQVEKDATQLNCCCGREYRFESRRKGETYRRFYEYVLGETARLDARRTRPGLSFIMVED